MITLFPPFFQGFVLRARRIHPRSSTLREGFGLFLSLHPTLCTTILYLKRVGEGGWLANHTTLRALAYTLTHCERDTLGGIPVHINPAAVANLNDWSSVFYVFNPLSPVYTSVGIACIQGFPRPTNLQTFKFRGKSFPLSCFCATLPSHTQHSRNLFSYFFAVELLPKLFLTPKLNLLQILHNPPP